jgi:ABC-type dipeptide/oligopeptide/nickel transport system ATPase component
VVHLLCDRVIVTRPGQMVEQDSVAERSDTPQAACTRELLAATPHLPV